jgi:hypothetical protein
VSRVRVPRISSHARTLARTQTLQVFGGQLYAVFGDAGARGVHAVGAGLPTTAGTRTTLLPGFETTLVQAQLTATLGALYFQDASTLWLVDAGTSILGQVIRFDRNNVTGRWAVGPALRFAGSAVIYSVTGRTEADGVHYLYVLSTAGTTGIADGALYRYNTATGAGLGAPIASNRVVNSRWRSVVLPPVDAQMAPATGTATQTSTPSNTASSSVTATGSSTATATASVTASASETATASLSGGATSSSTGSPSPTATATPTITSSPSNTATSSATPSARYVAFLPDNLLVVRAGDGTVAYSGGADVAAPVFLEELTLGAAAGGIYGTVAQRVRIAGPAGHLQCTLSNLYWRDGWATRSADGRFVTLLGLNVVAGAAWPGSAVSTLKTVARIAADGTADITTGALNLITAGNYYTHSSHTVDGSGHYVIGPSLVGCDNNAGIRYIPHGGSASVQLNATLGRCNYDSRTVTTTTMGGALQLVAVFADAGRRGPYLVGSGLPTTPGQSAALLPGFEAAAVQAVLGDRLGDAVWQDASTLFLADATTPATRHVHRFVLNATTGAWDMLPALRFATTSLVFSITGRVEADGVYHLYALATSGAAGTRDGAIFKYNTATGAGLDAPIAVNPTINTRWRSIVFPPVDAALLGVTASGTPSNSPTGSVTPSNSPSSSTTASPTRSATSSASSTATPTSSITPSDTPSSSQSPSASMTASASATGSLTATPTGSITVGQTNSQTATGSTTASVSATATSTASVSGSATTTSSVSGSTSVTASPTSSETATPTNTPSPRYQSFQNGNIVMLRAGDGTAAFGGATSTGAPVFFEEVNLLSPSDGVYGTISTRVRIAGPAGSPLQCALDKCVWARMRVLVSRARALCVLVRNPHGER